MLPRLVLLGRDELGAQFVQLAVRCFQLLIDQPDADGQRADMVARRLDHPGRDRQGLLCVPLHDRFEMGWLQFPTRRLFKKGWQRTLHFVSTSMAAITLAAK